jgi:2-polyprenyl-3-methyl-5-hydroxy-6-metoxy-1,4-benzoquinol methylase
VKTRRPSRETSLSTLRPALLYNIGRRIASKGLISFPCVPALTEQYMTKLGTLFELLGKPFSQAETTHLRGIIERDVEECWRASPFGLLDVDYETKPPPHPGIEYTVRKRLITADQQYADWIATMAPPLFGELADAKVLDVAASLGPAAQAPVLDIGAGNGRNALVLARRGHPVDALEPQATLAAALRRAAEERGVNLNVVESHALDAAPELEKGHYKLVVMAQVIASHFRDIDQVRRTLVALSDTLAPGGILLVNTFLATVGYKPDVLAQQVSQIVWSCVFTRPDFAFLSKELPFDLVTDESVLEYEKSRLPADKWPPTGWFEEWAQGLDLFALPEGRAPIDLRWLAYRKR